MLISRLEADSTQGVVCGLCVHVYVEARSQETMASR